MNEVTCPICGTMIKLDAKEHLTDQHQLHDEKMQKIALHTMKLEDRIIDLEKSKGYEGNE